LFPSYSFYLFYGRREVALLMYYDLLFFRIFISPVCSFSFLFSPNISAPGIYKLWWLSRVIGLSPMNWNGSVTCSLESSGSSKIIVFFICKTEPRPSCWLFLNMSIFFKGLQSLDIFIINSLWYYPDELRLGSLELWKEGSFLLSLLKKGVAFSTSNIKL